MSQPFYKIENLEHWYADRCVLNIPGLFIYKGEILTIIGPSGAGKSTLLRILNFLEAPTKGMIYFDGNRIDRNVPLTTLRRVTTVFQHPLLLNRSLSANLGFGLSLRGEKLADDVKRAWLARLHLDSFFDYPVKKLSAGEAQRVALARALIIKPDVLLLDEPTANLDPYNVDLIESILREENQIHHTTIILVTHNIFQARRIGTHTTLLLGGKVAETSDTEKFFTNPAFPETSAFLRGELIF